ncbi:MAG TPA: hypothetical protein VIK18_23050 [Pirellulales bacterium]
MNAMLRRASWLLVFVTLAFCVASAAKAGDWRYRLYGYTPRNYGYFPSNYVFPRYGLVRGYVYVEGPPYGSPAFDDPRHTPPTLVDPALPQPPAEEIEPAASASDAANCQPGPAVVRPALARKSNCYVKPPETEAR